MPVCLLKLTNEEFARMSKLIYDRTGIHLPESKLGLLSNRLRKRLRVLELDGFGEYYRLLQDPKQCEEELPYFLSAVTTNETYFFRNESLWKFFKETWIPEMVKLKKGKPNPTLRIWSAASSSGEEAYTAAMCLRAHLPSFSSWKISIVGSDISKNVLDKARDGVYGDYAVSRMPEALKRKWFEEKEGSFCLKQSVRELVHFQFHNLRDPFPLGNFDLIFLRNVLMYFDDAMKLKVMKHVTAALGRNGYLFVGDVDPIRSSKVLNQAVTLDYCGPNLYHKPTGSGVKTAASKG